MKLTVSLLCLSLALVQTGAAENGTQNGESSAFPSLGIVGGAAAGEGKFPHQVSVRIDGKHECGGAIIADKWILTAAHCVYGERISTLSAYVGSNKLNSGGTLYAISQVAIHPHYDHERTLSDLALLSVTQPFTFGSKVKAIALASKPTKAGTSATLTGWGYTKAGSTLMSATLQAITLKTISLDRCQKGHPEETINGSQLCTLLGPNKGFCDGDSGGPLITTSLLFPSKLIGVVSWGTHKCALGQPDVFTAVDKHRKWIKHIAGV